MAPAATLDATACRVVPMMDNAAFALMLESIRATAQRLMKERQTHDALHLSATIRAAQQGDDDAFRTLVAEHKEQVLRIASRFARDRNELDELAQDIFIAVHRSLPRYSGEAPLAHWVARITVRRCRDHLRRRYRRRLFTSLDSLHDAGYDPAGGREQDPRVETLFIALRTLKPDQQTALILFELEGYSLAEVAAHNGWSESNVKVLLHRGRQALRTAIEKLQAREHINESTP